jgi:hypothetical protein
MEKSGIPQNRSPTRCTELRLARPWPRPAASWGPRANVLSPEAQVRWHGGS